jgi:hypothetical protein
MLVDTCVGATAVMRNRPSSKLKPSDVTYRAARRTNIRTWREADAACGKSKSAPTV